MSNHRRRRRYWLRWERYVTRCRGHIGRGRALTRATIRVINDRNGWFKNGYFFVFDPEYDE